MEQLHQTREIYFPIKLEHTSTTLPVGVLPSYVCMQDRLQSTYSTADTIDEAEASAGSPSHSDPLARISVLLSSTTLGLDGSIGPYRVPADGLKW